MPETRVLGYTCNRCGHIWVPRSFRTPKTCPKCKSPYWNTPRVREVRRMKV